MRGSWVVAGLAAASVARATELTPEYLNKVYNVMKDISQYSWENGTKAEAILEYKYNSYSVFYNASAIPLPNGLDDGDVQELFDVAETTMNNRPASNTSLASHNGSMLLSDGAAGDPASLGVAVLIANYTSGNAQVKGVGYGDAATSELKYLLYDAPRFSNGAISHRADQAQYWSDFVFMVPPFLAYYGALNNNQSLLQQAYTQCSLYRGALRQSSGLWAHIVQGTGTSDPGLWLTGNAWAAYGMTRVLATIKQSSFASSMSSQTGDLQNWIAEILGAAKPYMTSNNLLRNYIDDDSQFEDSSGSALLSAAGLRLSALGLTDDYVDMSLDLLAAVSSKVNSSGYLTSVVDPYSFGQNATQSPEGQSFVILAYSAYSAWTGKGQPGNSSSDPLGKDSGAVRMAGPSPLAGLLLGVVAAAAGSWAVL